MAGKPEGPSAPPSDAIEPAPRTVYGRSVALDFLRIFAALWVVTFHWSYITSTLPGWLHDFMRAGYLGVDIFFMLSGAVIIHTAVGRSWSAFAQSRFLRLFPVYVAASALVLVFLMITDGLRPGPDQLLALTGVQFWLGLPPIIPAAWTLQYEVGFYALIVLLIVVTRRNITEHTVRLAAACFLVVWMIGKFTDQPVVSFLTLDLYGPMFVFGVLLGISRDVASLRANGPALLVAGALTFSSLLDRTGGNDWTVESRVVLVVAVMLAAIVLILWSSMRTARPVRVPWFHRWVTTLSLMTYPIYLIHNEFGLGFTGVLFTNGVPIVLAYAIGGAVVLLITWASVRFFEPWARERLRRLFGWGSGARSTAEGPPPSRLAS